MVLFGSARRFGWTAAPAVGINWLGSTLQPPVLVSYAYFEKDDVQLKNMEFFMQVGMGLSSEFDPPPNTDFSIVFNGAMCAPCSKWYPLLKAAVVPEGAGDIKKAFWGDGASPLAALLWRENNQGMDFAAHNTTLEWFRMHDKLRLYAYFIFLNSSVRGPFYPAYMPPGWAWTRAYLDRFVDDVRAVSSSLVCLPPEDAGGYGAKLESWAFALDVVALDSLVEAGTFNVRSCKLCSDGVVVMGEYGISTVLLAKGHNIATLMSRYPKDVDWRDELNWHCNNNAHPSRHGTYDGISMHPYEVVFIKASWHVGEPFTSRYTEWRMGEAAGMRNTWGEYDAAMYQYAVQPEAQDMPAMAACYDVMEYNVQTNAKRPKSLRQETKP